MIDIEVKRERERESDKSMSKLMAVSRTGGE